MKFKKMALAVLAVVVVFLAVGFVVLESWTNTPHGKLDTKVAVLLKYIETRGINLFAEDRTPAQIRSFAAENQKTVKGRPAKVAKVENTSFPGPAGPVGLRIYTPKGKGLRPVVIYYHGGGWVIGDLDSHDNVCRSIARRSTAVVVSVDYRLAPESPFPASLDDAYAALVWVAANAADIGVDADRIFLAGDSAGGNLAAVVAMADRDGAGPPVRGQILIYPATNLAAFDTPSHADFANGFFLTRRDMEKFRDLYLPDRIDRTNIYASPLLAHNLKGLPPALVITAGFDVLRDEGEAYANRMKADGVPVTLARYEGVIHGFISMDRILGGRAGEAVDEIARFVKAASKTQG